MKKKMLTFLFAAAVVLSFGIFVLYPGNALEVAAGTRNEGSWGDNGDGTYNNPILPGDYSDPDIIRVGEDYFAITSTFQFVPGITVLHSKDLVNWRILGGAVKDLTRISDRYNYDKMEGYGKIIWAPCITYQEATGTFYIHFCTPDEGLFVTTASREGIWDSEWTDLERVTYADDQNAPGAGWDDCGVLWDANGQGYLVANHFGGGYQNYMFRLSDDGKTLLDHGVRIHYSNDGLLEGRGEGATEAFKLFKKDGYYYFLHNGVVESGRELFFLRSKNIYGDHEDGSAGTFENPGKYEHSQHGVVEWGYHEWCQGNIVDTPDSYPGEKKWYFFTHQGAGDVGIGRPVCLVPVTWGEDGFPASKDYKEQWENIEKPMPESKPARPQTSDDFSGEALSPQWAWSFQPKEGAWSFKERPGYLRMRASRPLEADRLDRAPNSLIQRSYATEANRVKTKMELAGMTEGHNAGLMHISSELYGAVGVRVEGGKKYVCHYTSWGNVEKLDEIPEGVAAVYFKSEWDIHKNSTFFYSYDGKIYTPAAYYGLQWNKYRGDSIGLFGYNNESDSGYVDFDDVTYEMDVQEEAPLILGVDEGGEYEGMVALSIPRGKITVNGREVSRPVLSQPGTYTVRAEDRGLSNEVTFRIKELPPAVLKQQYDFHETTGDAAFVSLADGKLGMLEQQPEVRYEQGIEDKALRLDGTYGLKIGSFSNQSYSVSMWLKLSPENIGSCNSVLFGNRDNGSKQEENWLSARFDAGYPFVWSNHGGSRHDLAKDSLSYAPGQWMNYVVTQDRGVVTTYVDGDIVGIARDTSPAADRIDFYIGGTFWNDAFYGWLDDLRIYEGVLTQKEVEQHFQEKTSAANKEAKTDESHIAVSLEDALRHAGDKAMQIVSDVQLEDKHVKHVSLAFSAVTLTLRGNTQVETLNNLADAAVVVGSDFCGNVNIQVPDHQNGRVVAMVESGADCTGISVEGLPADKELKLEGEKLKITDKQTPPSDQKPTPPPDNTPNPGEDPVIKKAPGKVSGVKASAATDRVKLTWKKVSGAEGYHIYRRGEKDKSYQLVKTVSGASYTDRGRASAAAYHYKVCAYCMDAKKELAGELSREVKVLTKPKKVKLISLKKKGRDAVLKFNAVTNATSYRICRYDAKKKTYVEAYQVKGKKLYKYQGKKYKSVGNVKQSKKAYTVTLKKAVKGAYVVQAVREKKGYRTAVGAKSGQKKYK